MNKKGDIPTLFYVIIALFVVGMIVFTISHFTRSLYSTLDGVIVSNPSYNSTEAHNVLTKVQGYEQSIWDYVFLAFTIGYFLMLAVFAYQSRISNVLFWIFVLCSLFGLFLGVVLSNTWSTYSSQSDFATTIGSFPIMNFVLGNFYPIFVTMMIAMFLILLFGKFGGGNEF